MKTAKKIRFSIDESKFYSSRSIRNICKRIKEEQVETLRETYGENKNYKG